MAKKTLIVMRHAKASWKTNDPDPKRPLSSKGCRDAVVAGQVLSKFKADLALISPAERAEQTWKCATMGGARAKETRKFEELYSEESKAILKIVRKLPDELDTVILVGHEPTLSEVIMEVVEPSPLAEQVAIKFPTCAIAVIQVKNSWKNLKDGNAQMAELTVPRGKRRGKKDKK